MAAGPVILKIKDVLGNLISARFWSSDGSTTGEVAAIHHLDDTQFAQLLAGPIPVSGPLTEAELTAQDLATSNKQDELAALIGEVQANPTANTVLDRLKALLTGVSLAAGANIIGKVGIDPALNGVVASPAPAQDPILDHEHGIKIAVTASSAVFTPPAGCAFARFSTDVDTFIRTDDQPAADAAGALKLLANQPEILPVTPGVDVRAYAASSAVLRIIPYKAR